MPRSIRRMAALCLGAALLSGCSVLPGADVESLLRAPRLSGETSSVQQALNSYLGGVAALKYPSTGDFLSPFLFGDWDGDGVEEAAVLYTTESSGANVWIAILEPDGDSWRVSQQIEGLSAEVESVNTAHLRDAESLQLLVGYDSPQGDRYMVVYLYNEDESLQVVNQQAYTDMILADMTGSGDDIQDLILALPTETENGGIDLQLLTYTGEDASSFLAAQTLAVGQGDYNGCAGIAAGITPEGTSYLVLDGWAGAGGNALASSIITYDPEAGFLRVYNPDQVADFYRATLRYDVNLLSTDINGDGTVDIPTEITDGGEMGASLENRLRYLLWRDFATEEGGENIFGVYDSEYRFFLELPESMHGNVMLRGNFEGDGWTICNLAGTVIYCELRVVDLNEEEPDSDSGDDSEPFSRVANLGGKQLQARMVTEYYGLELEDIIDGVTVLA